MTRRSGFVATALTVASLVALVPSGARADQCKGVTMPPTIDVEGNRLVLNGMGAREATVSLDLPALGFDWDDRITVTDAVTGATYDWGVHNYVRLDPFDEPAHVFTVGRSNT